MKLHVAFSLVFVILHRGQNTYGEKLFNIISQTSGGRIHCVIADQTASHRFMSNLNRKKFTQIIQKHCIRQ
jgi:hypothetical protein